MQADADCFVRNCTRAFAEIQAGPNPLTKREVEILAQKRPSHWGMFRGLGR